MEGINETDDGSVRGEQDGLAVGAEFEACPLAAFLRIDFEGGERALVEGAQIVQFDAF